MNLNLTSVNFKGKYIISGNKSAQEEFVNKLQNSYSPENLSIQTITTPANIPTSSTMTIVKTNEDAKDINNATQPIRKPNSKPTIAGYMRALYSSKMFDSRYEIKDAFTANAEFDNNLFDNDDDNVETFRYRGMKYVKGFDDTTRVYNRHGELISKYDKDNNELPLSEYETAKNKFSLNSILFDTSVKKDVAPLHGARTIFATSGEYSFDKDGSITIYGKSHPKMKMFLNGDIIIFKNGRPNRILQPDGSSNPAEKTFKRLNKNQKKAAKSLIKSISWKLSPKTKQAMGISTKLFSENINEILDKINNGKKLSELSGEEIKTYKSFLSCAWKMAGTSETKESYKSAVAIFEQFLNKGIDGIENDEHKKYIMEWIEKNPERYEILKTVTE